ncbi:MAG: collagen binding domain-containing protein [Ilumatobacteraceae bacterium]
MRHLHRQLRPGAILVAAGRVGTLVVCAFATAALAGATTVSAGSEPPGDPVPIEPVPHQPATPPDELPPAETIAPEPAELAPVATVRGVMWLDRDGDGGRGEGEWPVQGATIVLQATGSAAVVPPGHLAATSEHPADGVDVQRAAFTGTDGSYQFDDVAPGDYVVTASVSIDGLEPAPGTWSRVVQAVPGSPSVVDFAAVGRGTLTGDVFDPATGVGSSAAGVSCTWFGSDGVQGTFDDAVFDAAVDQAGGFDLVGLPFGTFSCAAFDATSGRSAPPTVAAVAGVDVVQASLPLQAAAAPVASVLTLPATGSTTTLARAGIVSCAAGGAMLAVARHRARHPR